MKFGHITTQALAFLTAIQSQSALADSVILKSIGVVESDADAILVGANGSLVTVKDARWNGSGAMISPCLMLTAAHVIFGNTGRYDSSYEHDIRISMGLSSRRQMLAHPVAYGILPVPIIGGGKWKNEDEFKAQDWAIVRIDACQGVRRARHWLALSDDDGFGGIGGLFGFYDESLGKAWSIKPRLVAMHRCHYRRGSESALATTNCPSREGMSGGPFVIDKNGKVAAIENSNGYGVLDSGPDELRAPSYLLTTAMIAGTIKLKYGCDIFALLHNESEFTSAGSVYCGKIHYSLRHY